MRENKIEKHLRVTVARAGGATRKFVSPGHPGVPDRIVIWPRVWPLPRIARGATIHFVETKSTDGVLSSAQVREHRRLRNLGCVVLVLFSKALVNSYVERYK